MSVIIIQSTFCIFENVLFLYADIGPPLSKQYSRLHHGANRFRPLMCICASFCIFIYSKFPFCLMKFCRSNIFITAYINSFYCNTSVMNIIVVTMNNSKLLTLWRYYPVVVVVNDAGFKAFFFWARQISASVNVIN